MGAEMLIHHLVYKGASIMTRLLMSGVAVAALVAFSPLADAQQTQQPTVDTPSTGGGAGAGAQTDTQGSSAAGGAQTDTQGSAAGGAQTDTQGGGAAGAGAANQLPDQTGS